MLCVLFFFLFVFDVCVILRRVIGGVQPVYVGFWLSFSHFFFFSLYLLKNCQISLCENYVSKMSEIHSES